MWMAVVLHESALRKAGASRKEGEGVGTLTTRMAAATVVVVEAGGCKRRRGRRPKIGKQ